MTDILKRRGIEAAARQAGWHDAPNPYDSRTSGWLYPVFLASGEPYSGVTRWKAADSSATPKYVWWPKGVKDLPQYYMLPGLFEVIQASGGELHMVSGEPDLLTMVSAGITNVTCAFGEKNITTLVDDLKEWGVKRLIYWRDRDQTGLEAAKTARDALLDSGIYFECRRLPGAHGSKYDLNNQWIDCSFDAAVFLAVLVDSIVEELPVSPPAPPRQERARPPSDLATIVYERWCEDVERTAIQVWNLVGPDRQGFSKMIPCPFHQEHTASAHWNYQTHGLKCFGACGKEYNTQECAERLGFEAWDEYRNRLMPPIPMRTSAKPPNGKSPTKATSKGKTPIVSGRDEVKRVRRILRGEEVSEMEPFLAPYIPLRQFGGVARLWIPRMAALIISGSGMGKTAFCERCTDNLCVSGSESLLWGPEWTPELYQYRRVARWGGPNAKAMQDHAMYKKMASRGVQEIAFTPLSAKDEARADKLLEKFENWPGNIHYLDRSKPFSRILADGSERIGELRAEGHRVSLAIFDYAQKALSSGQNWAELELIFNEVSQFAVNNDVFAILVSQVNKGEADALKKRGQMFDMEAAQLLSDQKANLVITLNPVYTKVPDSNPPEYERHEKAWINVVKDSLGQFPARIKVKTAFHRHDWTDTVLDGLSREPVAPLPPDEEDELPSLDEPEWWSY